MNKIKRLIPGYMWLPLILTLFCNFLAYNGTRIFTTDKFHYNLTNKLDELIPFLPWTVVIYLGCYLFWIVNYIFGCRMERETTFRFFCADLFAKLICLLCYVLFPTTNIRPVIEDSHICSQLMGMVYRIDAADNLFPSIHCLTSWFSFIAVRRNDAIPKWYRFTSLTIAVMICISTLTTKQHVLIDVIGGVLLAELSYWFVKKSGLSGFYERVLSRTSKVVTSKRA